MGEAIKILLRMRERTQLAYVWFAGAFLDGLFKRLFSTIRISEADLAKVGLVSHIIILDTDFCHVAQRTNQGQKCGLCSCIKDPVGSAAGLVCVFALPFTYASYHLR